MAEINLADIINLLQREFAFQRLTADQLAWVASLFQPVTLDRETVVFSQGDPPDFFYLVFQGKVRMTEMRGAKSSVLNLLGPGDFFGESALLFDKPRTTQVITVERTTLLRLERDSFFGMLQAYPSIKESILATANSRRLARSQHFDFLGLDEIIYFIVRKHDFFLYISLIPPILLGIAAIPVLVLGLSATATSFLTGLGLFGGAAMLALALGWGIWNYVDWSNDFYMVTDLRVIWVERVAGLYESRREAPLDTILAVNVTSSQLGRIVGYGTVNVRTFTGGILMRRATDPNHFASFVEGLKKRAREISKEEEVEAIEQALHQALTRSELQLKENVPPPPSVPPPSHRRKKEIPRQISLRERIDNLLKVRYEEGGVITYRKHWFILFRKAWLPFLLTLGVLLAGAAATIFSVNGQFILFSLPLIWMGTILGLIPFSLWLLYDLLDWRNDIYRLTPEQIMDIERKPLGREVKKTAPLLSILSIEHERENLTGILLNFGTVTINVGETRFIFYGVFNPDQVHADISDYREALIRRQRDAEAAEERERMVNWLVSFYNETGKQGQMDHPFGEDFSLDDYLRGEGRGNGQ